MLGCNLVGRLVIVNEYYAFISIRLRSESEPIRIY
jgi:hypothetical protein